MSSFRRSTQKETRRRAPSEWIIVSKNELELLTSSQQEESRSFSVLIDTLLTSSQRELDVSEKKNISPSL